MSRTTKIVLGTLVVVLLCGLVSVVGLAGVAAAAGIRVAQRFESRPDRVAVVAKSIAEFELPEGWTEDYTFSLAGFRSVAYAHENGRGHIVLMTAPRWVHVDGRFVERRMNEVERNYGEVAKQQAAIRGQEVTLSVGEGVSSDGRPYRALSGMFEGQSGPTYFTISMPIDSWDEAGIDAFLASIK